MLGNVEGMGNPVYDDCVTAATTVINSTEGLMNLSYGLVGEDGIHDYSVVTDNPASAGNYEQPVSTLKVCVCVLWSLGSTECVSV